MIEENTYEATKLAETYIFPYLKDTTKIKQISFYQSTNKIRIDNHLYLLQKDGKVFEIRKKNGVDCFVLLTNNLKENHRSNVVGKKGKLKNPKILFTLGMAFVLLGTSLSNEQKPEENAEIVTEINEDTKALEDIIVIPNEIPKEIPIETPKDFTPLKEEKTFYSCSCPLELQKFIYEKCLQFGVPFRVMMSIGHQESGGSWNNNGKVSSTNDYGEFQINACNMQELYQVFGYEKENYEDFVSAMKNDSYRNAEASVYLISKICKMYDKEDYENIFGTYNGWVNWQKKSISQNYVKKCLEYMNTIYLPLDFDETIAKDLGR